MATGVRRRSRWARWSAVLVVALLLPTLAACGDSGTEGGQGGADTTPTSAAEQTVLSPELEAELAALVAEEIDVWMTVSGVPGMSLAVVGPGGLELTEVAGVSDLSTQTPVTPEDFWRFGSVTKPLTSATLYRLAEDGKVDLDAPVADYLGSGWAGSLAFEGIEIGDQVTVKQLLNYTAAFPEYANSLSYYTEALRRLDRRVEPQEILDWAASEGALGLPGEEARVTTVGHVAAGLVIEAVTGRPAHEVIREFVIDPGSGGGGVFLTPGESPPQAVVTGYLSQALADGLEGIWPAENPPIDYQTWRTGASAQAPLGEVVDLMVLPQELLSSAGWTGGGIEARPLDVAKVYAALFGGRVLSPESLAAMTTTVPSGVFAQGILAKDLDGEPILEQSGILPGYNSGAVYLPEWGIAVAASSNTESPGLPVRNLVDAVALIVRTIYLKAETDAAGG